MAEEEQEQQEESGGGKGKLFLLIGIGVLLVLISVGGTVAVLMLLKDEPEAAAEEGAEAAAEAEAEEEVKQPALYLAIKPPLLLTYNDQGRQRYAQVEMTLMARSQPVITELELHTSRIRNDLILAFSGLEFTEVQTPEGKELMRQQALETVQQILTEEMGEPGVEQVLFTNLVMQ